jgi:hypothetical protein
MRLIFLIAHGLRPSYLGLYGNDWVPTPNFDTLATESIVFDRHFADMPSADGFNRAVSTGRYALPQRDPVTVVPEGTTLDNLLRANAVRYLTLAADELTESDLIDAGHDDNAILRLETNRLLPPWSITDEILAETISDWEQATGNSLEPLLSPRTGPLDDCVENGDSADNRARVQLTYAAAVRDFDTWLGDLRESLASTAWTEAVLVVTSGHGIALGEHGILGWQNSRLHGEMLHLPLILRYPDKSDCGRRVPDLSQSIDLPATIAELYGVPVPNDWHGQSLLPLTRGEHSRRQYAVSGLRCGNKVEWSLRTEDVAVLLPADIEEQSAALFVKPDDYWEVNDLRQKYLDEAELLENLLLEFVAASSLPGPLAAPSLSNLENDDGHSQAG